MTENKGSGVMAKIFLLILMTFGPDLGADCIHSLRTSFFEFIDKLNPLIARKQIIRNQKSIACMAAYAVDQGGPVIGDGYDKRPWSLAHNHAKFTELPAIGPFCDIQTSLKSPLGQKPAIVESQATSPRPDKKCVEGADKLKDFIGQGSGKPPLAIFVEAMKLRKDDVVQALSFLSFSLLVETVMNKRSKSKTLKNQIPVTDVEEDVYGQFYHWWGHLTLNYTFSEGLFEQVLHTTVSTGYELYKRDWGDIKVDTQGRISGLLLACFIRRMKLDPSRKWWSDLNCDQLMLGENYRQPTSPQIRFFPKAAARLTDPTLESACYALFSMYDTVE